MIEEVIYILNSVKNTNFPGHIELEIAFQISVYSCLQVALSSVSSAAVLS